MIVSFDQAQRILASAANALPSESIAISEALGRVLAEPLTARLRIIGESRAGQAYAGTVGAAEAVRIFTGAPIPAAADRVIIQENIASARNRETFFVHGGMTPGLLP